MDDKFVVRVRKDNDYVIMSLRLEREIQQSFDRLAEKSGRSRNELMCMALRYALEHLEFIPDNDKNDK